MHTLPMKCHAHRARGCTPSLWQRPQIVRRCMRWLRSNRCMCRCGLAGGTLSLPCFEPAAGGVLCCLPNHVQIRPSARVCIAAGHSSPSDKQVHTELPSAAAHHPSIAQISKWPSSHLLTPPFLTLHSSHLLTPIRSPSAPWHPRLPQFNPMAPCTAHLTAGAHTKTGQFLDVKDFPQRPPIQRTLCHPSR